MENLTRQELSANERQAQILRLSALIVDAHEEETGTRYEFTGKPGGRGRKGMASKVAEQTGRTPAAVRKDMRKASETIGETVDLEEDSPGELRRKSDKLLETPRQPRRRLKTAPAEENTESTETVVPPVPAEVRAEPTKPELRLSWVTTRPGDPGWRGAFGVDSKNVRSMCDEAGISFFDLQMAIWPGRSEQALAKLINGTEGNKQYVAKWLLPALEELHRLTEPYEGKSSDDVIARLKAVRATYNEALRDEDLMHHFRYIWEDASENVKSQIRAIVNAETAAAPTSNFS